MAGASEGGDSAGVDIAVAEAAPEVATAAGAGAGIVTEPAAVLPPPDDAGVAARVDVAAGVEAGAGVAGAAVGELVDGGRCSVGVTAAVAVGVGSVIDR